MGPSRAVHPLHVFTSPVPDLIFREGELVGYRTMPPKMPPGTYRIDWATGPNVATLSRVEPTPYDEVLRYPPLSFGNGDDG